MSKKEILLVVEAVGNEKGVEKTVIFEALEAALATATRKRHLAEIDVRVTINRVSGDFETFRRWQVIADEDLIESPDAQIALNQALKQWPEARVGEFVEEPMPSEPFGRIAAQTARQVIVQKVREAERAKIVDAYQGRKGALITGMVKRLERGNAILDLGGNTEAIIFREDLIPKESLRVSERVRGYLYDVHPEPKGPQLFLSRTCPDLLVELFKLEVPEVGEGLIEIVGAARDPGSRAKIAVRVGARDNRIDPIGACVGMRGSRVTAVSNELAGERVDIILWDVNPAQFVINAMQPAEVVSIVIDEEAHSMIVAVKEENLSQAIGRGGQNVRLASQLTGWELNVMSETQAAEKNEVESQTLVKIFMEGLGVDEEIADILVREGFSTVDEVAYVPLQEMLEIGEFTGDLVNELRERAKDALLTRAIIQEETEPPTPMPSEDLLEMEGMNQNLALRLASQGVVTMEDLADQSVIELQEISGLDEVEAGRLIMKAREPWFAATR
ncbi:MAG: transcription termination factor NusA [Pseudomonadota bacterium]